MGVTRRDALRAALFGGGALLIGSTARPARSREPSYRRLEGEGLLGRRATEASALMAGCHLCPRACGVNRRKGERGFCRAPERAVVYSAHAHFGEEAPLVGRGGSGTIFFSHCNLRCVFCQNWPISHEGRGEEVSDEELAGLMLRLQEIGCHNINLVTPTHVMPAILGALRVACAKGLSIPLVYNTSGYERVDALRLLDGVVDIYLPDMNVNLMAKYRVEYKAYEYPEIARGITVEELLEAVAWAEEAGLTNLDGRTRALADYYRARR